MRINRPFAVLSVLAALSVAGQASAGQARPRSAPPAQPQTPPQTQSGSQSGQAGSGDRSRSQAERREPAPPAPSQSSRPQIDQRREAPSQGSRPQPSQGSRPQVDPRREALLPPQASRPDPRPDSRNDQRNDPRNDTRPDSRNDARNGRGNDNRGSANTDAPNGRGNDNRPGAITDSRNDTRGDTGRQAIPAPRDRYIDLNRDGRNDNRDSRVLGPQDRRDLERRNDRNDRYDGRYERYDSRYSSYSYNYYGPKVVFAPRHQTRFSRPWFSFRPLIRLPFGITLGYSSAFPSWYDPYIVGRPGYVRPYMPYGGVTFDIEPRDAELWIDGDYVGRVSDYSYYDPPLTLVAGRHYVELRDRDSRPLAFEITVIAGQVIPYQGSLPYYR